MLPITPYNDCYSFLHKQNDQSEARLRAVNLVGELFALPDSAVSEAFQSVFVEFLKRLTDREVEVRMSALDYVKRCLLSNPARPEAAQIFGKTCLYL